MELTVSVADRIARTRRQQSRALGGSAQAPAKTGSTGPVTATKTAPAPPRKAASTFVPRRSESPQPTGRNPMEREDLLKEFEALLPAATSLYRYDPQDIAFIKGCVCTDRPEALKELRSIVRQYRIDLVTMGFDEAIADGGTEPLMPRGVVQRARIQFRMDCLGTSTDENGRPYTAGMLDWSPEPGEWIASVMRTPEFIESDETSDAQTPAPEPISEPKSAKRPKP